MEGYSYIIELVDRISGPAKNIRQQAAELSSTFVDQAATLKKLEEEFAALPKVMDPKIVEDYRKAIDKQRAAVDGSASKLRALAEQQRKTEADTAKATKKLLDQSKAADADSNSLANVAEVAAGVGKAMAILAGIVAGGAALAIKASEYKKQTIAALSTVQGVGDEARATFMQIRAISDEIGLSEEKAQKLGLSLLDAGVARSDLGDTIKSIALLEKVRGEQAAGKLEEVIKKSAAAGKFKLEGEGLVGTGLNQADVLAELAKATGKGVAQVEAELKAGQISAKDGIAAINAALSTKLKGQSLLTVEGAAHKAWEMFTRLFEDVDTAPLLDVIKEVASWLDTSTTAGGALRWLVTTIFTDLFAAAKAALPYVKVAFLELVIVALRLYIAAKPIAKAFDELREKLGAAGVGGEALSTIISVLVGSLQFGTEVLFFLITLFLNLWIAGVDAFNGLTATISSTWEGIKSAAQSAYNFLAGLFSGEGGQSISGALIAGLIGGITGGGQGVIDSLIGVGRAAIDGVKGILGIASPSKVMAELGGYTAEGFAQGVDDGTAQTQGSLESAVAPPSGAGGGSGAVFAPVIQVSVGAGAPGNGQEIGDLVAAKVADALEELWLQFGGGASPNAG